MSLIETLGAVGVTPITEGVLSVNSQAFAPGEYSPLSGDALGFVKPANPMVTCMMVTTGQRAVTRHALQSYRRQAYENRELVIVTHPDGLGAVRDFLAAAGDLPSVSIHCVGREMTLGDCRNLAIARSRGDILMQWDDDDLYDPLRISVAVMMLAQSPAVAATLSRVLVWWPQRRLAAISERRFWEGSIAVWRPHAPPYPSLARGEDTSAVENLAATRAIATYDWPLLYIYTFHAQNTWDAEHFEQLVARSERLIQGVDYDELLKLLATRVPVLEYQADLPPGPLPVAPVEVIENV